MKVGILVEVEEGLDWDHWRRVCAAAERLGFESVWLSDHLQSPWFPERPGLETWTALAVAAAETTRITLGPLVSPVTFREPAIVARMATSLQMLSHGRLVVGLGVGWNTDEHRARGIHFAPIAERKDRLIQTVERIRCEVDVPILIGGKGRSTLEVVSRYADEWNVTTSSPVEVAELSAHVPSHVRRSVACGVLIARDSRELEVRAERLRKCVPPLTSVDAAREMGWIVGTRDEVAQRVKALGEVGIQRVILGHYDADDDETLHLLAEALL